MKTRVRREKGLSWAVLVAALAVPGVLCVAKIQELSAGAPPATKPARLIAVTVPPVSPDPLPAPAAPAVKPAPVESVIKLQGLIITDDQPRRAIVNGAIVKEGETIDGATVVRIAPDGVLFAAGEERFLKKLGG